MIGKINLLFYELLARRVCRALSIPASFGRKAGVWGVMRDGCRAEQTYISAVDAELLRKLWASYIFGVAAHILQDLEGHPPIPLFSQYSAYHAFPFVVSDKSSPK